MLIPWRVINCNFSQSMVENFIGDQSSPRISALRCPDQEVFGYLGITGLLQTV